MILLALVMTTDSSSSPGNHEKFCFISSSYEFKDHLQTNNAFLQWVFSVLHSFKPAQLLRLLFKTIKHFKVRTELRAASTETCNMQFSIQYFIQSTK